MKNHPIIGLTCLVLCAPVLCCWGADLVFVQGKSPHPVEKAQVARLAEFFGLGVISAASVNAASRLVHPGVVAIVTPADALPGRRPNVHVPVLVFGVSQTTDAQALRLWSGNSVLGCKAFVDTSEPLLLHVLAGNRVTEALAGSDLPAVALPACVLDVNVMESTQLVLAVGQVPVLVRVQHASGETFLMPQLGAAVMSFAGQPSQAAKAFSSVAAFLMFLKYAAADCAWKLDGQYANLTIDDPWLIQPYGRLDYKALLQEMERHRFHTTIAFIPWNFERSRSDAVTLFRQNPDKYSVAIHGNNHNHQEFGSYQNAPLRQQLADLQQAVARMERFQQLTGIAYDRFMVFPHSVAPEATFAALKANHFLGTANSLNVPLDSAFPRDPVFLLRPYTSSYAGILSLFRYPAESAVPETDLAINAFLGNPLLFYGHESMFQKGIASFNTIADRVNRRAPGTHWTSLGEISRHLYLRRQRLDHGVDAEMFSSEADLFNTEDHTAVFYVHASGWDSEAIQSLTVDGGPASLQNWYPTKRLRVVVAPHATARIRIGYDKDLTLAPGEIRATTLSVRALRAVSDFRDLYLSKSHAGHAISHYYYGWGFNQAELYLERVWWLVALFVGLLFAGLRLRRRPLVKQ